MAPPTSSHPLSTIPAALGGLQRFSLERAPRWLIASVLVALAAGLSAVQIWLRQGVSAAFSRFEPSPFGFLVLSNLVAWAPWVPLGLAIGSFSRRWRSTTPTRFVVGHLVASQAVTWAFLAYLGFFRALFVPEVAKPYLEEGWSRLLAREASDFYLVCLLLYGSLAVWSTLRARAPSGSVAALPAPARPEVEARRIEVRGTARTRWVPAEDVDWLEAAGNYTRLHTRERSVLHRRPLKDLVADLGTEGFVRIHRSHAVRLARVEVVEPLSHGDAQVRLADGGALRVSRRYRPDLLIALRLLRGGSGSSHDGTGSSRNA